MSNVADSNGCVSRYMYCASAPGKVILFGEHSVVYGQPAVAAALSDLRIFVGVESISRNEPEGQNIRITMKDLPNPVDLSIPIDDFIAVTSQLTSPPSTECTQALEAFIRAKAQLRTNCIMDDPSIHAILPVLYLISQLLPMSVLCDFGCIVTVRSVDLPVVAGLGSSAAFSVACAAALIQWKYHRNRFTVSNGSSPGIQFPVGSARIPPTDILTEINQFAYYSEMLLHGRPSGIDNTVSSHGGALSFTRSHHEVSFDPVPLPDGQRGIPLHLILVNTHVPRQTKKLVAAVRSLHDLFPNIFTPVLEAMGQISATFCAAMQREQLDSTGVYKLPHEAVLTLVRTNQSLLASLGVSHPSLDRICDTINNNSEFRSLAAAKLTGAGGGGCAMILLWPDITSADPNATLEQLRRKIITTLQAAAQVDYQLTFLSSTVGGDGVLFTSPSDFETVQCS